LQFLLEVFLTEASKKNTKVALALKTQEIIFVTLPLKRKKH
jgi:hypothetical protein